MLQSPYQQPEQHVTYTINIGLAGTTGLEAYRALGRANLLAFGARTEQSTTEPTLVAPVSYGGPDLHADVYSLALELNQDCIAIRDDATGNGWLIGPNASKWNGGVFDANEFIGFAS